MFRIWWGKWESVTQPMWATIRRTLFIHIIILGGMSLHLIIHSREEKDKKQPNNGNKREYNSHKFRLFLLYIFRFISFYNLDSPIELVTWFFFFWETDTHTREREKYSNIKTHHKLHSKVMVSCNHTIRSILANKPRV